MQTNKAEIHTHQNIPLSLLRVMHLHSILRDERVEEGVVFLRDGALFSSQDSAQSLRLLPSRSTVRRDLDQDVGFGQIEGSVGDFGHENRVDFWIVLKVLQDLHSLALRRWAVDEWLAHTNGVSC